jgi:hypothetical protein
MTMEAALDNKRESCTHLPTRGSGFDRHQGGLAIVPARRIASVVDTVRIPLTLPWRC